MIQKWDQQLLTRVVNGWQPELQIFFFFFTIILELSWKTTLNFWKVFFNYPKMKSYILTVISLLFFLQILQVKKNIWSFKWILIFLVTWNNIWKSTQKKYCEIYGCKFLNSSVWKGNCKMIPGEKIYSCELCYSSFSWSQIWRCIWKNIF